MTTEELKIKFNNEFGLGEWPKTYEVDAETYANCCQAVFNQAEETQIVSLLGNIAFIQISVGPSNGLLFKNVELILVKR